MSDGRNCKCASSQTAKQKISIYDCLCGTMIYRGFIEVDLIGEGIEDYCWELCNWSNWALKKPDNLFSDVDSCRHGICFYVYSQKLYHLALSVGWLCSADKEEIINYIKKNKDKQVWRMLKEESK